jgi:hypothetical protein
MPGSPADRSTTVKPDGASPYPLGFYSRGMDARIDDPNAAWKGRALWANYGTHFVWHIEGGEGTKGKMVKSRSGPIHSRADRRERPDLIPHTRGLRCAAIHQVIPDGEDLYASDGLTEVPTEMPAITRHQMRALCVDGSQQNWCILWRQRNRLRQRRSRSRFVSDFDTVEQSVQACSRDGVIQVAVCLCDRKRTGHQDHVSQRPQRQRGRDLRPPSGRKQNIGVEENAVGVQREFGGECGTESGSIPSDLTSARAARYSSLVTALFSRNSALRFAVYFSGADIRPVDDFRPDLAVRFRDARERVSAI